jgi:LysM repeat protein
MTESEKIDRGVYILSSTNVPTGVTLDLVLYVVAKGDTLASISRRFGLTVQEIRALNPEIDTAMPPLRIGQVLRIRETKRD